MVELAVLKLFTKDKGIFLKYRNVFSSTAQEDEITLLFNLITRYYTVCTEHEYISEDELVSFYHLEYPAHKNAEHYKTIIHKIYSLQTSRDLAEELIVGLINRHYATQIVNELLPVVSGETSSFDQDKVELFIRDRSSLVQEQEAESPFSEMSLDDLLIQNEGDGMAFRLSCVRKALGCLPGGTLGHVFARPEVGKTSFLHSEVTYLAPQLEEDDCIVWINNEEPAARVKLRQYCAISGMTVDEIRANPDKAKQIFQANGGRRIHLVDEAVLSLGQIEKLCKEYRPRFVVIDQGDKVTYQGAGKAGNTAERLKAVYDGLREVVKRCNTEWKCDILTVGQADAASEGKRILAQANLDAGKTGKAGAFDYIIGIGYDPTKPEARYITFCKNKLLGDHGTYLAHLNPHTGRYTD